MPTREDGNTKRDVATSGTRYLDQIDYGFTAGDAYGTGPGPGGLRDRRPVLHRDAVTR